MEHHPAAGVARVSRSAASRLPLWKTVEVGKLPKETNISPNPSHHFSRWWFSFLLRWDMDDRSRKMVPYASLSRKAVVCGCNCQLSSPFSCRLFGTVLKGFQSQLNTLPTIMKGPWVTQQGQMPGPTTATVRTGRWVKFAVGPLRWKTGQLPQAVLDHQHGICWRSWRRSSKIADVAQVLWRNAILTI